MADSPQTTTTGAILAFIGGASVILLSLPRLLAARPTYGPRLKKGELKASEASQKAADAYWAAEEAASRGSCDIAHRAWTVGERFRAAAEERAGRGDQTGRNLKPAVRAARKELQKCVKRHR